MTPVPIIGYCYGSSRALMSRVRASCAHLPQRNGLSAHRGREGVGNIVCSDPEGREEGSKGPQDENPQELIGCFRDKDTLVELRHRHGRAM